MSKSPTPRIFKVDKITAAGCQLDTAIRLIFEGEDQVSACVLIHSAWSIIKDLLKHKSTESSRDWMTELYPEKTKQEVWQTLDQCWNFFKHAKDDPHKILEFPEGYVEPALILALHDFSQLSVLSKSMDVFQLWFIAVHKEHFENHEVYEPAASLFQGIEEMDAQSRLKIGREITEKYLKGELEI